MQQFVYNILYLLAKRVGEQSGRQHDAIYLRRSMAFFHKFTEQVGSPDGLRIQRESIRRRWMVQPGRIPARAAAVTRLNAAKPKGVVGTWAAPGPTMTVRPTWHRAIRVCPCSNSGTAASQPVAIMSANARTIFEP